MSNVKEELGSVIEELYDITQGLDGLSEQEGAVKTEAVLKERLECSTGGRDHVTLTVHLKNGVPVGIDLTRYGGGAGAHKLTLLEHWTSTLSKEAKRLEQIALIFSEMAEALHARE